MCHSDTIPFHVLTRLLLLEVPVHPVGTPEKTELLDEAVKVVLEKVVIARSRVCPLPRRQLDIFTFKTFLTNSGSF
jgi:hypothetical protein